jgi:hypothetical protein
LWLIILLGLIGSIVYFVRRNSDFKKFALLLNGEFHKESSDFAVVTGNYNGHEFRLEWFLQNKVSGFTIIVPCKGDLKLWVKKEHAEAPHLELSMDYSPIFKHPDDDNIQFIGEPKEKVEKLHSKMSFLENSRFLIERGYFLHKEKETLVAENETLGWNSSEFEPIRQDIERVSTIAEEIEKSF